LVMKKIGFVAILLCLIISSIAFGGNGGNSDLFVGGGTILGANEGEIASFGFAGRTIDQNEWKEFEFNGDKFIENAKGTFRYKDKAAGIEMTGEVFFIDAFETTDEEGNAEQCAFLRGFYWDKNEKCYFQLYSDKKAFPNSDGNIFFSLFVASEDTVGILNEGLIENGQIIIKDGID